MRSFSIAPMDGLMRTLTIFVGLLPLVFLGLAAVPSPVRPWMGATSLALLALYAGVWLIARPDAYLLDAEALVLRFPLWSRRIPRTELTGLTRYPGTAFRDEVGWGMRVGAGGLFGAFGWLVTGEGTFEMYVSRVSDLVVVHRDGGRDLLLSPGDLDGFAAAAEGWIDEDAGEGSGAR